MQVMQGWSGEVQTGRWAKVDVTLNETDIGRVVYGAGIAIDLDMVPLDLAWRILDAEAEKFILVKLIRAHGYQVEKNKARLIELGQEIQDILAKIREIAAGVKTREIAPGAG